MDEFYNHQSQSTAFENQAVRSPDTLQTDAPILAVIFAAGTSSYIFADFQVLSHAWRANRLPKV